MINNVMVQLVYIHFSRGVSVEKKVMIKAALQVASLYKISINLWTRVASFVGTIHSMQLSANSATQHAKVPLHYPELNCFTHSTLLNVSENKQKSILPRCSMFKMTLITRRYISSCGYNYECNALLQTSQTLNKAVRLWSPKSWQRVVL
jgi:hypothetical protein